jgi:hypothetical protein
MKEMTYTRMVHNQAYGKWFIVEHGHLQPFHPDRADYAFAPHMTQEPTRCHPNGQIISSQRDELSGHAIHKDSDDRIRRLNGARRMFEDDFVRFMSAYQHWRSHSIHTCHTISGTLSGTTTQQATIRELDTSYRRLLASYIDLTRLERSAWRTSECLDVDEGGRSFAEVLRRDFTGLQGCDGAC